MRQIIWIGLALAMLTSCDNRSNRNYKGTICPLGLEQNLEQDSMIEKIVFLGGHQTLQVL